jgi:hypothetical protein
VFGVARGCARAGVIVVAERLCALVDLLGVVCGFFFCFDLGFALAVGGFGFLEDGDDVLALRAVSRYRTGSSLSARLTLLTTFPLLLMTVMVSPTPMATDGWWTCSCTAGREGVVRPRRRVRCACLMYRYASGLSGQEQSVLHDVASPVSPQRFHLIAGMIGGLRGL